MPNEDQNTNEFVPVIEKQGMVVGVPFKVLPEDIKDSWKTNYAYYRAQLKKGIPKPRPLIAKYTGDNNSVFQVYDGDGWVDANFWDYAEPKLDDNGNALLNKNGKPRMQPYFDCKKVWTIEFKEPVEVQYWSSELKQMLTEAHTKIKVKLSKNLSGKLQEQVEDPRNGDDASFQIDYDPSKAPAEQYKVKYVVE